MGNFYFILGAESSGTRMMCNAIQDSNDFGIGGVTKISPYIYKSKWMIPEESISNSLIKNRPQDALFVRSIPRGSYPNKEYIDLLDIYNEIILTGYALIPIVMYRNPEYLIQSQLKRKHVSSYLEAKEITSWVYAYISKAFYLCRVPYLTIYYGRFVDNEEYRREIFNLLCLDYPEGFIFRKENDKYGRN